MARRRHIPVKKVARVKKQEAEPPASDSAQAPPPPVAARPKVPMEEAPKIAPAPAPAMPRAMQSGSPAESGVPDGILEELRKTAPWVMYLAILQFLGALGCLLITLASGVQAFLVQGASNASGAMDVGSLGLTGVAVAYGIATLVYLFLGLRMVRFCKAVGRVRQSGEERDLEFVLGYIRGIWQIIGASLLVFLVLVAVMVFIR